LAGRRARAVERRAGIIDAHTLAADRPLVAARGALVVDAHAHAVDHHAHLRRRALGRRARVGDALAADADLAVRTVGAWGDAHAGRRVADLPVGAHHARARIRHAHRRARDGLALLTHRAGEHRVAAARVDAGAGDAGVAGRAADRLAGIHAGRVAAVVDDAV